MGTHPAVLDSSRREKKALRRRATPDQSQRIRFTVQIFFAVLNVCLGIQFYLWARFYERGGAGLYVPRPAGAEGWLPIAGLMNLKLLLVTGRVPLIHPAAMFLLIAFLLTSFLAKKSFCAWLCPVGALSERIGKLGQSLFRSRIHVPRWLDIPLRGLKYLLLAFFVFFIAAMPANTLQSFMQTPYGLIADVKMLNFFRGMSATAVIVILALALLSLFIENVWCRYLCPYGALMGLVSLLSPFKIRRNPAACIDCGKCASAPAPRRCPSTSWCRFAPSSARPAWPASLPARRKALLHSHSRPRVGPRSSIPAVSCSRSAWSRFLPPSFSEPFSSPAPPITGKPMFPAPSIRS